jgi:outer membrane protein OmpA-like peptidoglycan-associated protein
MKVLVMLFLCISISGAVSSQSIGDRVLKKSKQRANRKLDRTIDKGLDKVEKGIDDGVSGQGKEKKETPPPNKTASKPETPTSAEEATVANNTEAPRGFEAFTKFDFVPGSAILFFDDFATDHVGDFPARWNTNGSGEVVTTGDDGEKWFELKMSSTYIPDIPGKIPDDYTMEFDFMTSGLDKKTSSTAQVIITLDDNNTFKQGRNFARVNIPLMQFGVGTIKVLNAVNGATVINNDLRPDLRDKVIKGMHVSIAVNGRRFRMWMDEEKILDLPTLVPKGAIQSVKFELRGFANDYKTGRVFMNNVKLAAGGLDLRSKLISEGKLSTTAITFDVNSDRLKPESMGIIKEIAGVLAANPDVNIKIVGHTDSDGDETKNLSLSKKRAAAVKMALVENFQISGGRIETDGQGESMPAGPNDTSEGKAANRRVEFIKL